MHKASVTEKPWHVSALCVFLTADCVRAVGSPTAMSHDARVVMKRYAHEGEAFLTKTLPAFGKAFDLALQGTKPLTQSFFKRRRGTAKPLFLGALHAKVFSDDGVVLAQPCTKCIRLIRQVCFWFKKLERGYSDEVQQNAIIDLIKVDDALPTDASVFPASVGYAQGLVTQLFKRINMDNLLPKHGPGAVASGEDVVGKRELGICYKNLEAVFRPIPFFFSLRDAAEDPQRVYGRPKFEYGLSRTELVNKDAKDPRIIGLEPGEYQWAQQSLKRLMYDHIETHPFTRGHVNFTDQSINREQTKRPDEVDTLDMSKASDRNALVLVVVLFKFTKLLRYLLASRTPGTVLPNDMGVLWYKKFAPMGSATCFPVQAVVYWALAVTALHELGMPLKLAMRSVYVYGDDLVVPHGTSAKIMDYFGQYGLVFNESKCCTSGLFRESCGLDSFAGVDVTPVRHKRDPKKDVGSWKPIVEHTNSLYLKGYWSAAAWLKSYIDLAFIERGHWCLPTSTVELPVMHFRGDFNSYHAKVINQQTFVHGWVEKPAYQASNTALEMYHLRESLSTEGPVGVLKNSRKRTVRHLALKYRSKTLLQWVNCPYIGVRDSVSETYPTDKVDERVKRLWGITLK